MATANLKKSEEFVTNITAAYQYIQGGPSMVWFFDTCCHGSRC